MKKRLWIGVATAALMLGGVSAGLVGASKGAPVKAAAGDYTSSIQLVGAALGVGWTNTANTAYQFIEQSDGTFAWTGTFSVERFRAIVPDSWTKALNWDNVVATSAKVADGTFVKASTIGSDNDNNIWCKTAGTYTLSLDSGKTKLSITAPTATQYDVTEYEVVDGVLNSTAIATEKATDGVNFTPTDIAKSGYKFKGWYTDSACTTAYAAKKWTAAGNLYAKYTTAVAYDVYFAFANGNVPANVWSSLYVYTFGGNPKEAFGAWPGTKVTDVTDGVSFQSQGGIYKINIPATCNDTGIIFNNNSGTQTPNLVLADHTVLYWSTDTTGSGDKNNGDAAAVVYHINAARRAVTASGKILVGSLCGISKATAQTLVDEYDALGSGSDAQGYVNASTDYVYNYQDTTKGVDVTVNYLVAELRLIAASGSGTASISNTITENNGLIITLAILGAGAVAAGAMFVFRKKRHEAR
jgi:hypothetical protein